ncbi:7TM GPCR protein [Aphelenchoides avenae]|nr:7TM GPCR protein [Aphelenchus avenae]
MMNGCSIIFNAFLLYLVRYHSSFGTPVYQVMLAVDASLDLILSVFVLFGQPICITGAGYKVFISDGFFAGWSYALDQWLIWMWVTVLHFNVMWIAIQFVYRYAFLCLRDKMEQARRIVWSVIVISIIWGIAGIYMCYKMSHQGEGGTSQAQGIHALELNDWDLSHKPIVVGSHITHWVLKAWISMWTVSCLGSTAIVAIFELKIKKYFDAMGAASHTGTRKMHRDFHRALMAMAICPLITTSVPILYYMAAAYMELSPGPNQAFMTMAVSSITMFNPLTTIFFMRSYRQVILRPFMKKRQTDTFATRVTGLSTATSVLPPSSVAPSRGAQ